eukprot:1156861-Pelagomonas_calceolata.AAC.8
MRCGGGLQGMGSQFMLCRGCKGGNERERQVAGSAERGTCLNPVLKIERAREGKQGAGSTR